MRPMTRDLARLGRTLAAAGMMIAISAAAAYAACVPQSDGPGCFPTDFAHSKCEQKVGTNAAKLARDIFKCHRTLASRTAAGQPFDDDACEATAVQKFIDKTSVIDCPCVDATTVASIWEIWLDASNHDVYCAPGGVVFGGDDTGRAPLTSAQSRCEGGISKCAAKLVKDHTRCHVLAAKAAVNGAPFDQDACEDGPIPGRPGKAAAERYDACIARVAAKGGCAGCEDPADLASVVAYVIDARNDDVYCMDQPQSACPSTYEFTAFGNAVDQDFGWAGFAHDQQLTSNVQLTLAVSGCANASPPCGTCTVAGPIPNTGGPTFANRRCRGADDGSNGSWIECSSGADCPGSGNACVYFLGPPQPLAYGGIQSCVTYEIADPISGTLDVESGAATMSVGVTATPHTLTVTPPIPCPQCLANVCDGGVRQGMSCTVHGASSFYGHDLSFDCPPDRPADVSPFPMKMLLTTGTQTATVGAGSPSCTNASAASVGLRCMCDTCDNAAATLCFTNADCVAVGATRCGGRRCLSGPNTGTPCAANSECAGGGCGRIGEPTSPNACDDLVCTPNTPPDGGSPNEGICAAGPFELYCTAEPYRGCRFAADCEPGDTCTSGKLRECFTDNGTVGGTVSASGVASPTLPTLSALLCVPPTRNIFWDVRGAPGLGRVTIPGIVAMH
jgi:hypothetical protein